MRGRLSLGELARLRRAAYRLLGGVLLYPDEQWMATFSRAADGLLAETQALSEFAFWGEWERLLRSLQALDGAGRSALETAYVRTFVVATDRAPCLPCESAYSRPETAGWILAELDRQYALAGFAVDPASREPPDHAAVELEFMSALCRAEASAWGRRRLGKGVERLEREAAFLGQHPGRWFPEFASLVVAQEGAAFYALAAAAARTFIAHDLDLVHALLGRYREVAGR